MIAPRLQKYLEESHVAYEVIKHRRTFTSRETADLTHIPADHLAKGAVCADGKGCVLVVIPASRHVRLHAVQLELDRPLKLAREREFQGLFDDCAPGALPPFGFLYGVETLIDDILLDLANNYFEAGDHEHVIHVSGTDFRRLIQGMRHGYFSRGD